MISGGELLSKGNFLKCVVLDVSLTGARVHLLSPEEAPRTVVLHLPGGDVRTARRCWQRDSVVGFEFSSFEETEEPAAEMLQAQASRD